MVKFRSGLVSGPYTVDQLRWTDEGSQWCVVAAALCKPDTTSSTWSKGSGGY